MSHRPVKPSFDSAAVAYCRVGAEALPDRGAAPSLRMVNTECLSSEPILSMCWEGVTYTANAKRVFECLSG